MTQTPGFEYSHELQGNVLVQDLTGWTGQTAGMNRVEREWRSIAEQPEITAAVTEFNPDLDLGPVPLSHLVDEWSENASRAGVEKLAFVSQGIEGDIESLNVDVPQEVETFAAAETAIRWARE